MTRIFVFAAFIGLAFAACKERQEDVMGSIKKNCTTINEKLKDYSLKRVDDLASGGTGSVSGYFKDDEVKKVTAQHFTDTCRIFTDYYYDDGMLIFVLQQSYLYNKPQSYTEEKAKAAGDSVWYDDANTRVEQQRFYFNKNKLIKWVQPGNVDVPINRSDFHSREQLMWGEAAVMLKQLKE